MFPRLVFFKSFDVSWAILANNRLHKNHIIFQSSLKRISIQCHGYYIEAVIQRTIDPSSRRKTFASFSNYNCLCVCYRRNGAGYNGLWQDEEVREHEKRFLRQQLFLRRHSVLLLRHRNKADRHQNQIQINKTGRHLVIDQTSKDLPLVTEGHGVWQNK